MYHGVDGDTVPSFIKQLEFVARNFAVVPLDAIVATCGAGVVRGDVALTFDDGLRNNYSVVYPILKRLGLPATYFVCPGLIGSRRWLWTHEARERLRQIEPTGRLSIARAMGAPGVDIEDLIERLKGLALSARQGAEEEIRALTPDFDPDPELRERHDVMTWEELSSLDPGLITIGSHTMSHPILTALSPEEIAFEIQESRRVLETRLNRHVTYFCYPNGEHDARAVELVRASYSAAVTSSERVLRRCDDPYRLPRIPVDPRDVPRLAWCLHSA
jgi:peptidoglycan/xylan/chitin deacetylase (PgdA/CDA1 family)